MRKILILILLVALIISKSNAQGTWTPLTNMSPDSCGGVMLLLSDGTVIAKGYGGYPDSIGSLWNKLTPDIHGSYVNGTWSPIASMHDTRLYFSSQVLTDGRVYVAGGEYGTGAHKAEIYNPVTNVWTMAPIGNTYYGDANSEILPNGKVLEAILNQGGDTTTIYNPVTNSWEPGAVSYGNHDESVWLKLPDNSILFVDLGSRHSERYIPAMNKWISDGMVPDSLYDSYNHECGGACLLPNGRAFFIGATSNTAYYTPSGDTSHGTWALGPAIPNGQGAPDAAAAMMVNGNILCAFSPAPVSGNVYQSPTKFYEFNYITNTYMPLTAPDSNDSLDEPCYYTNMLNLPDGTILYASQASKQYYVYTPSSGQLTTAIPTIDTIIHNSCDTLTITGTLFNGISEGSTYGDDWQMATNYPVIRLTSGTNVYYARTFNWNRTGVQTGSLADTATFTLPANIPQGMYSLVVTANGISSNPVSFNACSHLSVENMGELNNTLYVYPNPADKLVTIAFSGKESGKYKITMMDVLGRIVKQANGEASVGDNFHKINIEEMNKGIFMILLQKGDEVFKTKLVIE